MSKGGSGGERMGESAARKRCRHPAGHARQLKGGQPLLSRYFQVPLKRLKRARSWSSSGLVEPT